MITEDYVRFETAKLLKEKGFDEYCPYIYLIFGSCPRCVMSSVFMEGSRSVVNNEDIKIVADKYGWESYSEDDKYAVLCPTLQMAMKWLREEHNLYIEVHITNHSMSSMVEVIKYYWVVKSTENAKWKDESTLHKNMSFDTHEEAAENAIKYCLEKLI